MCKKMGVGKISTYYFGAIFFLSVLSLNDVNGGILWSPPVNLSLPEKNAMNVQLSSSDCEHSHALWSRFDGSNFIVEARLNKKEAGWSKVVGLSMPGSNAFFASSASDSDNNTIAVWSRANGTDSIIQAAYKPFYKEWRNPVDISIKGLKRHSATKPQIAFDSDGNAFVVWQLYDGKTNQIQCAYKKRGNAWSKPVNLTFSNVEGFGNVEPQIVIDPKGNVVVLWINESTQTVCMSIKPVNEKWSPEMPLSASGQPVSSAKMGVDATGKVTAVWVRNDGTNNIVQTLTFNPDRCLSFPIIRDISLNGEDAGMPQIAIDQLGNRIIVWQGFDGVNTTIQAAIKRVGGNWLAPVRLSALGFDASEPQVKIDSEGPIVVIWKRSNGSNFVVESSIKKFGETSWSRPVVLSATGQDAISPQLTFSGKGRVVAAWQRSNGANSIVQSTIGLITK